VTLTVRNARDIAGLDGSRVDFDASNEYDVTRHVVTINTGHRKFLRSVFLQLKTMLLLLLPYNVGNYQRRLSLISPWSKFPSPFN